MAELAGTLLERGDLAPPLYANVLLGAPGNAPARAEELVHVVGTLPRGTVWAAAGIGVFQLPITAMATFMGGHVRTGLEDNAHLDSAGTPATNEDLVRRAADLAVLAQRPLATPAWTRAALRLQCIDGSDGR
jgi:3-keto-5-aminohexanoate cleavage enzyme